MNINFGINNKRQDCKMKPLAIVVSGAGGG
jgi:hypothetical protein